MPQKPRPDKQDLTHLRATLPAALEDVSAEAWEQFQALQNENNKQFQTTRPSTDLAQLRKMRVDEKKAAAAPGVTLEATMVMARRNNRVCPLMAQWVQFHQVLVDAAPPKQVPPYAIDGGAWNIVPGMQKRLRLKEQLEWADKHGCLPAAHTFLNGLPEEAWLHF